MEVTRRAAAGLRWVVRKDSDDRLGPERDRVLDAIVTVPKGGVFLDVGAHVGHFALRASRRASTVVAFEPDDFRREGLEANLALNGIENVRVVAKPLAQAPDEGATSVDAEAESLARVDLIRVDVQGAEAIVLEGARRTLARHKPRVVVEMHDRELRDPAIRAGVLRVLGELGYAWREVHSDDTNDHLYCLPAEDEDELDPVEARAAKRRRWEAVLLAPMRVREGVQRRWRALGAPSRAGGR